MGVGISMNDSVAMRGVSAGRCTFGAIRVFGTLGWGIFGFIAGYINDHDTMSGLPYLLPGLFMFIIVICVDIMIVVIFFKQDTVSSSNIDQVKSNFTQPDSQLISISRESNEEQYTYGQIWSSVSSHFPLFVTTASSYS